MGFYINGTFLSSITIKNLYFFLKSVLIVAVVAALLIYLYINWKQFTEISWWHRPHLLLAHIFLLSLMFFALITGWRQALFINGVRIGLWQSLLTFLIPNFGKYIPGKILMFAGRIALCKQMKIGPATSLGAIIVEHTIMVTATLPFVVCFFLSGYFQIASRYWYLIGGVVFLGLIIILRPSFFIKAANWIIRHFKGALIVSAPSLVDTSLLFGTYLIGWTFYGFSGVVLAYALGIENVPVDLIFSGFIIAWLIGFLSFLTPGGIGVREVVLCVILNDYADNNQIFALAFAARVLWTLLELSSSGISMFWVDSLGTERDPILTSKNVDVG